MKKLKRERRGEGWSGPRENKRVMGSTLPPQPPSQKTHRASGWPHRAAGVKGERKGLFCAFRPSGAQSKHADMQPHKNTQAYTHAKSTLSHTQTQTHSARRWLWPRSLCSANQKTVLNHRRVSQCQGATVETLAGRRKPAAPPSAPRKLYKD